MGIPHSFISRVSNETVLQKCQAQKLSTVLLHGQLDLLRRIAKPPDEDVIRRFVFKRSTFELVQPAGPRRKVRPRSTWVRQVYNIAVQAAGSATLLQELWQEPSAMWHATVKSYCAQL